MKYPYIGEWKEPGLTVLFVANCEGFEMGNAKNYQRDWSEGEYTNITHEHLANTYGEVQSPEHAEFIIGLCLENSISFYADSPRRKYFAINGGKLYFFCIEIGASNVGSKKITIPLPPKADKQELSEWPQVESIVTWGSGHAGVVKSLSDEFAWVKRSDNSQYVTLYVSSLEKTKTPEEEFASELIEKYKHLPNHEQAFAIARDVIDNAIAKTKKPQ